MDTELNIETENIDSVVCPFFLQNRCRFVDQCRNFHPADVSFPSRVKPTDELRDDDTRKKSRMRTASDVIHRIVWDPSLDSSEFRIVYLDRFTGNVSIPLTEFVSLDPDDRNSIPQHRIQHICYHYLNTDHIVWDKQSRTDHVFGSGTLLDFIRKVKEEQSPLESVSIDDR